MTKGYLPGDLWYYRGNDSQVTKFFFVIVAASIGKYMTKLTVMFVKGEIETVTWTSADEDFWEVVR